MIIKSRISFKEYRNLLMGLAYKKPMMKIIVGVGAVMFIWIVGYYTHVLPVPEPKIYQYLTLGITWIVQPIVIYWTIKRSYFSSNHLREEISVDVNDDELKVKGDSFFTEIAWKKIFKVVEQEYWFLVYQNTWSAI